MEAAINELLHIFIFDENHINYANKARTDASINSLNDDCLMHVFQFLSIVERIRVERVCKRWQRVSQESWFNYTSLNFYRATWGLDTRYELLVKDTYAIYEVLKRCGRYLKHLEFLGYIDELLAIGACIGSLCPNLESLDLSGVSSLIIKNIADNCTNIRNFCLRDTIDPCDDQLSLLFLRNKKLKSLEFICEYSTNGGFMLDLPAESIEKLNILNSTFSTNYFNEAIRKMKNLSKLSFDFCDNFDDESMEAICSVSNLREIQMGRCLGHIRTLNPMTKLINLKTVEFSLCNYVDDEFLITLSENCRELSDVNISGCRVTDVGVASITLLPKLERLNIDCLQVTDKALNSMPKLKAIECVKCKNITTTRFSQLIETSENLELLNVCHCKLYNSTIRTAINATKKRTNGITLKMYVQGTRLKLKKLTDASPFLEIILAYRHFEAKDYV